MLIRRARLAVVMLALGACATGCGDSFDRFKQGVARVLGLPEEKRTPTRYEDLHRQLQAQEAELLNKRTAIEREDKGTQDKWWVWGDEGGDDGH
jgi:hypothetical protein